MEDNRYESLLDENTNLKRAVSSTKHILERTLNDYETLKQIHEDFKHQYTKVKKENDEASQRYIQLLHDKKDHELHFDNTIRNFKMAIEQKQKELEEVSAKIIPSVDNDMMRIKVINELEGPHRQALEAKQQETDRLQDQVYELKRIVEITNSKYDSIRFEAEKDIRDLKERHKYEVNDLMQEIQALQERLEDTRDKDIIRIMRRDLDEIKFRYDENETEMEELRREKERLREEKNDILIKLNKQVDIEKTEKRNYKSENDKLLIRVRQLENELSKFDNRHGDVQAEAQRFQQDNDRLHQDNENKQKIINSLQNQIRDLEDGQLHAQTKLQEYISSAQLQGHERQISEKNRIASLQREIESYQKTIVDLENKYRTTNFQTTKDYEMAKQELVRFQDQQHQVDRTLQIKEEEISKLKKDIENLHDEMYYAQRKNKEAVLGKTGASPATHAVSYKATGRDGELLRESLAREEKLKTKVIHLKAKLKHANKKIMELLPHKILAQRDPNQMLGRTAESANAYVTANPGNLLENLKSKYGISDGADIPPVTSDVKHISAKYGFGIGQPSQGAENDFQGDMNQIRSKYGFEAREIDGKTHEELLHTEIARTADDAYRKYGGADDKYW
jgi:chromosome segregation ATPase